jgi:uncharacterized protein
MSDFEAAPGEYPFKEPVRVSGGVFNRAGVITIKARADCGYVTRCDRCLKEITERFSVTFENVLAHEVARDIDDEIIVCADDKLDLDDLAGTNIILSLSMKHLCREDCRGLCPKCGKDLNEGNCNCGSDYINPQFSQLKNLIQ